jgi:translation initiation factor IF-1
MLKIASFFAPAVGAWLVATSAGAQAPDPAKPGVVEAEVVQLQATVTAVDRADRAVSVRDEDGREVEVTLSDQVKNFDQIKAGDTVTVTLYEATAIFVRKAEGEPAAAEAGVVQVARPGDKPAGISTDVTEITATVEDIDTAKRIVKLKGPEGKIRVLKVGKDVKNLAAVKKGDQLVIRHTEEVAIAVTE